MLPVLYTLAACGTLSKTFDKRGFSTETTTHIETFVSNRFIAPLIFKRDSCGKEGLVVPREIRDSPLSIDTGFMSIDYRVVLQLGNIAIPGNILVPAFMRFAKNRLLLRFEHFIVQMEEELKLRNVTVADS